MEELKKEVAAAKPDCRGAAALFAQELRTPMPVSVKRLMKSWESLQR